MILHWFPGSKGVKPLPGTPAACGWVATPDLETFTSGVLWHMCPACRYLHARG